VTNNNNRLHIMLTINTIKMYKIICKYYSLFLYNKKEIPTFHIYNTNESNTIDLIDYKNESTKSINKELIFWTLASITITNRLDKLTNIKYFNKKIFSTNNQSIIINKFDIFIGYINEYYSLSECSKHCIWYINLFEIIKIQH